MARLANTTQRYGAVAMALHWIMAALIVALLGLGLYMVSLPDVGFDRKKITLILYHKELGILAFVLVALRLGWRFGNRVPRLAGNLPEWQKVAARFVHLCFYGLLFALPITGWVMSSAAAIPVSFLGWFQLPDLVSRSEPLFQLLMAIHKWLGYALIAFVCVHVGAALRHHFVLGDDTLRKMLPGDVP